MSEARGIEDYKRQGTDWIPVRQTHFLDIVPFPEFTIEGKPSRTLGLVLKKDFVATVAFIRHLYIPNHDPRETDILLWAYKWVKDHKQTFEKAGTEGKGWGLLPDQVLYFYLILGFPLYFQVPSKYGELATQTPVAYKVGTADWKNDIHRATLAKYEKFKLFGFAWGKDFDRETFSSTRSFHSLTEFFWSGGQTSRVEGADILTWEMLKVYWLHLLRRLESVGDIY